MFFFFPRLHSNWHKILLCFRGGNKHFKPWHSLLVHAIFLSIYLFIFFIFYLHIFSLAMTYIRFYLCFSLKKKKHVFRLRWYDEIPKYDIDGILFITSSAFFLLFFLLFFPFFLFSWMLSKQTSHRWTVNFNWHESSNRNFGENLFQKKEEKRKKKLIVNGLSTLCMCLCRQFDSIWKSVFNFLSVYSQLRLEKWSLTDLFTLKKCHKRNVSKILLGEKSGCCHPFFVFSSRIFHFFFFWIERKYIFSCYSMDCWNRPCIYSWALVQSPTWIHSNIKVFFNASNLLYNNKSRLEFYKSFPLRSSITNTKWVWVLCCIFREMKL